MNCSLDNLSDRGRRRSFHHRRFDSGRGQHHDRFGVLQLDAHADLRENYNGSRLSHACAMARVGFHAPHPRIGIRNMDIEEARRVKRQHLPMCTMDVAQGASIAVGWRPYLKRFSHHRCGCVRLERDRQRRYTGAGRFVVARNLDLLQTLFSQRTCRCDVVELSYRASDPNSPFAVAKLIYKMVGFKFAEILTAS
jgi:agmatinase